MSPGTPSHSMWSGLSRVALLLIAMCGCASPGATPGDGGSGQSVPPPAPDSSVPTGSCSDDLSCSEPTRCPPGSARVSKRPGAACEPCGSGGFCAGGAAGEQHCPVGSWDHDQSAATPCEPWSDCLPGTVIAVAGTSLTDRQCARCESSYSDAVNRETCQPWAPCDPEVDVLVQSSATSPGTCIARTRCESGQRVLSEGTLTVDRTCAACPEGTYSDGTTAECTPWTVCTSGEHVAQEGSSEFDRSCVPCESGTFGTEQNAQQCVWKTSCSAGSFVATEGSSTQDRACAPCLSGSFSATTNSPTCVPLSVCPAGTVVSDRGTVTRDRTCAACARGTFTDIENGMSCRPQRLCGPSSFEEVATVSADRTCVARAHCAPGERRLSAGSSATDATCAPCPEGTTSEVEDASSCVPLALSCAPGEAPELQQGGGFACVACEHGTYCPGGRHPALQCDFRDWDLDPKTPCSRLVAIEAAGAHVCALDDAGEVYCWGANEAGQLDAPAGLHAVRIFAGLRNTCALLESGAVVCWGARPVSDVPAEIRDVRSLAIASDHACAALSTGRVACWGAVPDSAWYAPLPNVIQLVSDGRDMCALTAQGRVECSFVSVGFTDPATIMLSSDHVCGIDSRYATQCVSRDGRIEPAFHAWPKPLVAIAGSHFALVDDTTVAWWAPYANFEAAVGSLRGIVDVAEAPGHGGGGCALASDGSLSCFGPENSLISEISPPLGHVAQVSAGWHTQGWRGGIDGPVDGFTCVRDDGGAVDCWGAVPYGLDEAQLQHASDVSAGGSHVCVVSQSGDAYCGGGGNQGGQTTVPAGIGKVVDIEAGDGGTCVIDAARDVHCWPWGAVGTDGVLHLSGPFRQVAYGFTQVCTLGEDAVVHCWSGSGPRDVPADLGEVASVSAGAFHACAARTDGTVSCWGDNDDGESTVPAGLGHVEQVAAGWDHTCSLDAAGKVVCWGASRYDYGQLAVPSFDAKPIAISTRGFHTCAVLENGKLSCWGTDGAGESHVLRDPSP